METSSSHQHVLLKGLEQLYSDGLLCDFTLKAGDISVDVHRCVLAASSPYFKALLTFDTCDTKKSVADLEDIESWLLKDIVQFMYTGCIDLTGDNAQSLLIAADMLQIDKLIEQCLEFLSSHLCIENCVDMMKFADFLNKPTLKETSTEFTGNNLPSVYRSDAFLTLDFQNILLLLDSYDLYAPDERLVYEVLMMWIEYDVSERKKYLEELLSCVRFVLIPLPYIISTVAKNELIVEDKSCLHTIEEHIEKRLSEEIDTSYKEVSNLLRRHRKMICYSGDTYPEHFRAFQCIDPVNLENLSTIPDGPTIISYRPNIEFYKLCVTDNDSIYCIGGVVQEQFTNFEASKDVFLYNQYKGDWERCADMKVPSCAFGCCYNDGTIYVFGGFSVLNEYPPLNTVSAYNIKMDSWSVCRNIPIHVAHPAVVTYEETALLFGGLDENKQYLRSVLQYSFSNGRCTFLSTEMPIPRAQCSAFVDSDRIFVLGGYHKVRKEEGELTVGSQRLDIFHIKRLCWGRGSDFPEKRTFTSVCHGDGCLYVYGGSSFSTVENEVTSSLSAEYCDLHRYDSFKDTWLKLSEHIPKSEPCNKGCVLVTLDNDMLYV